MNRLRRILARLRFLPPFLRMPLQSFLLGWNVPFVGTARLQFHELTPERVVVRIRNRRRVRNHLGGVHAAAMALLAETASGFAVAMHIPDGKIPVIKRLAIDYVQRARGGLTAVAHLRPEDIEALASQPKGEAFVLVTVQDENGGTPITCEAIWAWISRRT
jgi:uncharacterized protein (TIGR00369 family)